MKFRKLVVAGIILCSLSFALNSTAAISSSLSSTLHLLIAAGDPPW